MRLQLLQRKKKSPNGRKAGWTAQARLPQSLFFSSNGKQSRIGNGEATHFHKVALFLPSLFRPRR